jgi:energy-converting hydrogenase Eha subunit C
MTPKQVKIVSALCMIVGAIGTAAESEPFLVLLGVGFVGFIVGRFME